MASINLGDNASQVVKYWSQRATTQLREKLLMGGLVNKDYQGEIKAQGDTVKIYSVAAPTATVNTIGTSNSNVFAGSAISSTSVDLVVNEIATAAFEFSSENEMMSILNSKNSECMSSLVFAVEKAINSHLYSVMVPSIASPDHTIGSVATFDAAAFLNVRLLASTAKWDTSKPWYALLDPLYYGHQLALTTNTSQDFVADRPVVSGLIGAPRYGFTMYEDNSQAPATAGQGYFFHPDAVNFAMASSLEVKMSDLHPTGKHGIMLSVSCIYGAALGIAGAKKCIKVTAAA